MAHVYNLAADMGGMGFIESNKAAVHDLGADQHAPADGGAGRGRGALLLRVVGVHLQRRTSRPTPDVTALRGEDAYPAMPEDGYGWEKLFSERMCRHFREDFGLETRVARYHNVYGPHGTYDGGREKAPAAICRKVAQRSLDRRSRDRDLGRRRADPKLHVHRRLPRRHDDDHGERHPATRSTSAPRELVTINQLVDIVEEIAGARLHRRYLLDAPQGVRGRNSTTPSCERPRLGALHAARRRARQDVRWIYDCLSAAPSTSTTAHASGARFNFLQRMRTEGDSGRFRERNDRGSTEGLQGFRRMQVSH